MRHTTLILTSLLATGCLSSTVFADSYPPRKPGLWDMSVSTEGAKGLSSVKQCIDKETDAKLQKAAMAGQAGESCSKNEVTAVSGGYRMLSVCSVGGSTITSDGMLKGSFDSGYTGDIVVKYDPPMFGQSESKVGVTAKWLGECPPNMKPGDMTLPNGKIVNLVNMQKQFEASAQMLKSPQVQDALKNAAKGIDPKQLEALAKQLGQQVGQQGIQQNGK